MLYCPDAELGLGIGTKLQLDPFHNWETAGNPALGGVGPPKRSIGQREDQTAKQCDDEVQVSAGVDIQRSFPNGCGLGTLDHDEPFQASAMVLVGVTDRPVFGGSTVPTARQKEVDVQDTACRSTDPDTAGIGSVLHCVPFQPSARARSWAPTCW
jgi:hypothetical protein